MKVQRRLLFLISGMFILDFAVQSLSLSGELHSLKDRFSHAEYMLHLRQKRFHFLNLTRNHPCKIARENGSASNSLCPEDVMAHEGTIEVPTIFQHLPHLLERPGALVPRVLIGRKRSRGKACGMYSRLLMSGG